MKKSSVFKNIFQFLSVMILFTSAVILISSCNKEDEHEHSDEPPVITISSPVHNTEFDYTDTVFIKATIMHHTELHSHTLKLHHQETGDVFTLIDKHDHSKNVSIDTFFYPGFTSHAHFFIIVNVTDHDGLSASDTVFVHIGNH